MAGAKLLRSFAEAYPEACFVEIGANDGEQHDHLRPLILAHAWSGVMVEPVPYIYERLERNYAGIDRVTTANVAIGERDGELPFYHLVEPADDERASLPDWCDGIGSFSRDAVLSHADHIPDVERRVVQRDVAALSFESLCARFGLARVDLVVVDTEGYDWRILSSIDLESHHPRLLVYEHFHLPPAEREACRRYLEDAGYETLEEGFDTFCLDTGPADALTAAWPRLRPAVAGVSAHDVRG